MSVSSAKNNRRRGLPYGLPGLCLKAGVGTVWFLVILSSQLKRDVGDLPPPKKANNKTHMQLMLRKPTEFSMQTGLALKRQSLRDLLLRIHNVYILLKINK